MEDVLRLAAVLVTVIGVPMLAITVIPLLVKALGRAFGGDRPDPDVLAELEDLRTRVQQLEEREARMMELEERMEFTERVLARGGTDTQLPG